MQELVDSGSNVLHSRSLKIAEKYRIKIIVKSTFTKGEGSVIK